MTVPIRPEIAALPAYRAGKTPPVGPTGRSFKLSSNENPFPVLPGVVSAIERAAAEANQYPDALNTELTQIMSARLGVSGPQLCFGTGSVALIYQALQTVCLPGDEVITAWRSFEAYPIAIGLSGARHVRVPVTADGEHDLNAMAAAVTPQTKAILVCTPNNPTGPVVSAADFTRFLDQIPDQVLVLLDEAYYEFVTDPDAVRGEFYFDRPNVVVLRTFAKAFGLAGLRVGYCIADVRMGDALRATTLPFGVSRLAQAAAVAALESFDEAMERVQQLITERQRQLTALRELGWRVPDSQANFVWIEAGAEAVGLTERLASAGITVRPFADEGVRISIGLPEANELVRQTVGTAT